MAGVLVTALWLPVSPCHAMHKILSETLQHTPGLTNTKRVFSTVATVSKQFKNWRAIWQSFHASSERLSLHNWQFLRMLRHTDRAGVGTGEVGTLVVVEQHHGRPLQREPHAFYKQLIYWLWGETTPPVPPEASWPSFLPRVTGEWRLIPYENPTSGPAFESTSSTSSAQWSKYNLFWTGTVDSHHGILNACWGRKMDHPRTPGKGSQRRKGGRDQANPEGDTGLEIILSLPRQLHPQGLCLSYPPPPPNSSQPQNLPLSIRCARPQG